jgi:pimeloyl-ACP methyl ester carboxylesterase
MNTTMTHHRFTCADPHGSHTIVYTQRGDVDNPQVLICLHGLTRNARDFDALAAAMSPDYRVLCIDVAGRGQSDWLRQPEDYSYAVYVADMLALLEHLQISRIDLVGTSMGGHIGMFLAAQSHSLVRRLVMNDIGPYVPRSGLLRIARHLTQPPPYFPTLEVAEQYCRLVHAQFGSLPDACWQHITRHSIRGAGRGYRLCYDPNIALPFNPETLEEINLWSVWEEVRCPVLVLHGEKSDLLSEEIIRQMTVKHPLTQSVTFPEVGHAPALMEEKQIKVVKEWLLNR